MSSSNVKLSVINPEAIKSIFYFAQQPLFTIFTMVNVINNATLIESFTYKLHMP